MYLEGTCEDYGQGDLSTFCTAKVHSLVYKFADSNKKNNKIKGGSQAITTTISAEDAIETSVATKIGSYAVLLLNVTSLVEDTFIGFGNMSFGSLSPSFSLSQQIVLTHQREQERIWCAIILLPLGRSAWALPIRSETTPLSLP